MTEEYEFCDQCLKDITKKRKIVKEGFNQVFCSRSCRDDYFFDDKWNACFFIMDTCYQCRKSFTKGQLIDYKSHGCLLFRKKWDYPD